MTDSAGGVGSSSGSGLGGGSVGGSFGVTDSDVSHQTPPSAEDMTTADKLLANPTPIDNLKSPAPSSQDEAPPIPGMPLYHLGRAALGSQDNFDTVQNAIDYLDKKAQSNEPFNESEKEFMKELYEAFSWGGKAKGLPEAATLANHYVNGNGQPLTMSSEPYTNSVVVNDTTTAMKSHINDLANNNQPFQSFKTDDPGFRQSQSFKPLMMVNGSREIGTEGYVRSDGLMFAEQNNQRLQKADNRFYLKADTIQLSNGDFQTTWRVDNVYDFESYSKGDKVTDLDLSNSMTLKLPDGLSEYMDSGLGVAKPFDYHAEWTEVWR